MGLASEVTFSFLGKSELSFAVLFESLAGREVKKMSMLEDY